MEAAGEVHMDCVNDFDEELSGKDEKRPAGSDSGLRVCDSQSDAEVAAAIKVEEDMDAEGTEEIKEEDWIDALHQLTQVDSTMDKINTYRMTKLPDAKCRKCSLRPSIIDIDSKHTHFHDSLVASMDIGQFICQACRTQVAHIPGDLLQAWKAANARLTRIVDERSEIHESVEVKQDKELPKWRKREPAEWAAMQNHLSEAASIRHRQHEPPSAQVLAARVAWLEGKQAEAAAAGGSKSGKRKLVQIMQEAPTDDRGICTKCPPGTKERVDTAVDMVICTGCRTQLRPSVRDYSGERRMTAVKRARLSVETATPDEEIATAIGKPQSGWPCSDCKETHGDDEVDKNKKEDTVVCKKTGLVLGGLGEHHDDHRVAADRPYSMERLDAAGGLEGTFVAGYGKGSIRQTVSRRQNRKTKNPAETASKVICETIKRLCDGIKINNPRVQARAQQIAFQYLQHQRQKIAPEPKLSDETKYQLTQMTPGQVVLFRKDAEARSRMGKGRICQPKNLAAACLIQASRECDFAMRTIDTSKQLVPETNTNSDNVEALRTTSRQMTRRRLLALRKCLQLPTITWSQLLVGFMQSHRVRLFGTHHEGSVAIMALCQWVSRAATNLLYLPADRVLMPWGSGSGKYKEMRTFVATVLGMWKAGIRGFNDKIDKRMGVALERNSDMVLAVPPRSVPASKGANKRWKGKEIKAHELYTRLRQRAPSSVAAAIIYMASQGVTTTDDKLRLTQKEISCTVSVTYDSVAAVKRLLLCLVSACNITAPYAR